MIAEGLLFLFSIKTGWASEEGSQRVESLSPVQCAGRPSSPSSCRTRISKRLEEEEEETGEREITRRARGCGAGGARRVIS